MSLLQLTLSDFDSRRFARKSRLEIDTTLERANLAGDMRDAKLEELMHKVGEPRWHHTIDLGNGVDGMVVHAWK